MPIWISSRQFILLANKLSQDLRRSLSLLGDDLREIKKSIDENTQAFRRKEESKTEVIAIPHEAEAVEAERRSTQRRDRIRLRIEALTLLAVVGYGFVTFLQWRETKNQTTATLRVVHIEQRPWVTINPTHKEQEVINSKPEDEITGDLLISNIGKTIAHQVKGTFRMSMVLRSATSSPESDLNLEDKSDPFHPPMHFEFGTLSPNDPPRPISVLIVERKTPQGQTEPDHLDMKASNLDNSMYMRVFGMITYVDSFGQTHWTKYCNCFVGGRFLGVIKYGSSPSKKCVEYNDADQND